MDFKLQSLCRPWPRLVLASSLFLIILGVTPAQTAKAATPQPSASPVTTPLAANSTATPAPTPARSTAAISKGYDTIKLGMAYQAAYDALVSSVSLDYRGTPDLSLSPGRDEKIIETRGGRYIKRGIFQFRNDTLFTIILELNPAQLDYYSLYTTFVGRYGEAFFLTPQVSSWEDGAVRLILEKPLTLKYLDIPVIEKLRSEAGIEESVQERNRSSFIERL